MVVSIRYACPGTVGLSRVRRALCTPGVLGAMSRVTGTGWLSGSVTDRGAENVPLSPVKPSVNVIGEPGPDVRVKLTVRWAWSPTPQPSRSYSPTPWFG